MVRSDRRREVVSAAWQVIVREGLDRTSLRAIAQEMNATTGVVTHYFRNKQDLILFALHQVTERLQVLMAEAIANTSGTERLVAILSSFLPLDRDRQEILQVWIAFLGYAVGRSELMAEHQRSAASLRKLLIQELQALHAKGAIHPDLNLESEANVLLALGNGLSLDTFIQGQPLTPEQQEAAIRRYVQTLEPSLTPSSLDFEHGMTITD